jgi:phytoene/squalene synthetase
LLTGSKACGRTLQKTNIIKDFVEDLARQVCYLPDAWLRSIDYTPLALAGAPAHWSYGL